MSTAREQALKLAAGENIDNKDLRAKRLVLANLRDIKNNCNTVIKQLVKNIKDTEQ